VAATADGRVAVELEKDKFPEYNDPVAKVNYSIAEVISGKLELSDYQAKIGQVLAENFADIGDWQINLADYGLAATESQRFDNYVQTSNNPQIGSLAMTFDLNKGQIQYQGFPISSTSAATAGVRARAEGLLEYGSPRAGGSMGGYNIGSAYTVDANNLAQATDTASQTTVALAKFGNAMVRKNVMELSDLFKLVAYSPAVKEYQEAYDVLKNERFSGSSRSQTVMMHGVGKPIEKGDEDPTTHQISALSWESFSDRALPKINEDYTYLRWNAGKDKVNDAPIPSLMNYFIHREDVLDLARNAIIAAYQKYKATGEPINLIAHSLGSVILFEVLQEAEKGGIKLDKDGKIRLHLGQGTDTAKDKYFTVDKFIVMGAFIKSFHDDPEIGFTEDKVRKFINLYNPKDEGGQIYGISIPTFRALMVRLLVVPTVAPFAATILVKLKDINNSGTGKVNNDRVQNIVTDSPHTEMLYNVGLMRQIKDIYQNE